MIQRQQSLWLVLSTICAFLTYELPFFSGTKKIKENMPAVAADLDAGSIFFLLVLTGFSLLLSLITIFMFRERKLQLKLCFGGIVLSALIIFLYFVEMQKFETGSISLSAIFVFAVLIGYIMAARGIWKDEKLVRNLDKLR